MPTEPVLTRSPGFPPVVWRCAHPVTAGESLKLPARRTPLE